jgi:hypothetical protein
MSAGTGGCVEIKDKPYQFRRAGCPEILDRRQAEPRGRQVRPGSARPFVLGLRRLTRRTRCRICQIGVKGNEGMSGEAEESDQDGEEKDTPRG